MSRPAVSKLRSTGSTAAGSTLPGSNAAWGERSSVAAHAPGLLQRVGPRLQRSFVAVAGLSLLSTVACDDEEGPVEEYGAVRIELRTKNSDDGDPFRGTKGVDLKLHYDDCLRQFYAVERPDMSYESEEGRKVFESWEDRLCAAHDKTDPYQEMAFVDCAFQEGTWTQTVAEEDIEWAVRVRLDIGDDDMKSKHLRFGPVPTERFTYSCQPLLTVRNDSLIGVDDNRKTLWKIASVQQETQGPDSAIPMRVEIVPKKVNTGDDDDDDNDDDDLR